MTAPAMPARDVAAGIGSARRRRLRRAQATLRRVVDLLARKYGVRRVVLIGSLAESRRFGFHSDIDLAVVGLPPRRYFEASGEVLLLADEFDVDLIPAEDAAPAMVARIERGEVVYDQG